MEAFIRMRALIGIGGAYWQKHIRRGALIGRRALNRIITVHVNALYALSMILSSAAKSVSDSTVHEQTIICGQLRSHGKLLANEKEEKIISNDNFSSLKLHNMCMAMVCSSTTQNCQFYLSHHKLVCYVQSWQMLYFSHDLLVFKIRSSFLK